MVLLPLIRIGARVAQDLSKRNLTKEETDKVRAKINFGGKQ